MKTLDKAYWQNRYRENETGWDVGAVSTPIKAYVDQLTSKSLRILIPGAGNSHEAQYLHELGHESVYVLDWAEEAFRNLKARCPDFPEAHLIIDDFFSHRGTYDLIIEQTFFCALDPSLREKYAKHMADLLHQDGKLVGLLFNDPLGEEGPPFGGNKVEYERIFIPYFDLLIFEAAYNSIEPRAGKELFMILRKK